MGYRSTCVAVGCVSMIMEYSSWLTRRLLVRYPGISLAGTTPNGAPGCDGVQLGEEELSRMGADMIADICR